MWPFKRKKQGRRLEAARARSEQRAQRWRRLREAGVFTGVGFALLFAVLATMVLLLGGRMVPHQPGQMLEQAYLARADFSMTNPENPDQALIFHRNDVVVPPGIIDEIDFAKITAAHEARLESGGAGSFVLYAAGIDGLVLLVTIGLGIYVYFYQPRVIQNPLRTLALAALLLTTLLAVRLTVVGDITAVWLHVFTAGLMIVLMAMILAIAYNQRFALGASWFLALLVVPAANNDFPFLLVLLSGVLTASLGLSKVRSRTKLVTVGAGAAAVMSLLMLANIFTVGAPNWSDVAGQVAATMAAGLAAGFMMTGLLPLIERIFGIATAMTLLEYSDVSKPVLRRLATEAPGTFNHSLLLGTMAESAAESIGANGLLARVGAYYHDIGKINKPSYFVENEEGRFNKHTKLSPAMSLLIILGHVKDGLEMAKEYNLPRVMWPFITEHHGTTLIEYFYHAAKQAGGDEKLEESQFRYPGPKPQSKETAILMLCDSVEGATRALPEPNAARIEDLVHKIARKRLDDGQLDECNLTLQELKAVEQSLIKSLLSFYHGRISYPKAEEKEAAGKPA